VPAFRVVLVEPKSEGNVGSVARAMKNFGLEDLVLVRPPRLADEAKGRAMHAWDVVESARHVDSFDEAVQGTDFIIGTSARIPASEKAHVRNPVEARDLPRRLAQTSGTVALCFGREDFGLFNEELERCDLLVTIPTSDRYKSLNLSHAVAVVLYELYVHAHPEPFKVIRPMSEEMKRAFYGSMDLLIDQLGLPEHKVRNTKIVYRRLFGRAVPSAWEFFVFMGIVSHVLKKYGIDLENHHFGEDFDLPTDVEDEIQALLGEPVGSSS
jgi:tRNA/rRNA methyltransferase